MCELEDPVVVETSGTFRMAAGEARYFELLHVHNDSVAGAGGAGALLGLSLAIAPLDGGAPFSTRVSGEHALSLEFFRVATRDVPALPVHVLVGPGAEDTARAFTGTPWRNMSSLAEVAFARAVERVCGR